MFGPLVSDDGEKMIGQPVPGRGARPRRGRSVQSRGPVHFSRYLGTDFDQGICSTQRLNCAVLVPIPLQLLSDAEAQRVF